MSMISNSRLSRALAPALTLVLMGLALSACQPAKTATTDHEPRVVRAQTVTLEKLREVTRYAAVIRPRIEADLGFRIAGKVTARLVEVGSRVETGTPLALLDPADIELNVRSAKAQLAAAEADARNAADDFARYAKLKQGEWTTSQEYDRRKTALEKAEAQERAARAALDVVVNTLSYTTLKADGPGVVTAVLIEPGQVVTQGQPAIRVARDGELEAVANIPEHKIDGLDAMSLAVELWSSPGLKIAGRLREVTPAADPGTRTFQARVSLIDPPDGIRQGMTATLVTTEPAGVPTAVLPMASLVGNGRQAAVWVVDTAESRLVPRPVEVALYAGDTAHVTQGLRDGDVVVTAGVHKLQAGQKVRRWAGNAP